MRLMERTGIVALGLVVGFVLGLMAPRPSHGLPPVVALEPTTPPAPTVTPAPTATSYCHADIDVYKQSYIAPLMLEWDDALSVARRTTKMSLPPQIERLQQIQRKLANVTVTSCTNRIHANFQEATDQVIAGLLAFLDNEPVDRVEQHFVRAESAMREVRTILDGE